MKEEMKFKTKRITMSKKVNFNTNTNFPNKGGLAVTQPPPPQKKVSVVFP